MTTYTYKDFAPGKSGPQFILLDQRLAIHGFPLNAFTDTFQKRVQAFQLKNWPNGSTAPGGACDGIVGPETWRRLLLDPEQTPPIQGISRDPWKLTRDDGTEVKNPALQTYSDEKFYVDKTTGLLIMEAECSGKTTSSNTAFARTEFRETLPNSTILAKWNTDDGFIRRMIVSGVLIDLPTHRRKVVLGQCHDANDDVVMVAATDQQLFVEYDDGKILGVLDSTFGIGQEYSFQMRADDRGFSITNLLTNKSFVLLGSWDGCYWKAGVYNQATSNVPKTSPKYGTGSGMVGLKELSLHKSAA